MKSSGRRISFLVTGSELDLLDEISLYGADVDEVIDKAKPERGKYRLTFSYEELEDLIGFVGSSANPEKSPKKQKRLDALYDKIRNLLKLSEGLRGSIPSELRKAQRPSLKNFIFGVWLAEEKGQKILRNIQIAETKTLYNFALVITQAFGFYFDHCFGFYENLGACPRSGRAFELFVDVGEEPTIDGARGVKRTKINQAFKSPGERMQFLFDYGHTRHFMVELREIKNAEKWDLKPVILQSIGKAPEQYPIPDQDKHLYER